jgi:hypothetical protein
MKRSGRFSDYLLIVGGSVITAIGVAAFITPAKLAGGGVSGIAVILYHLCGFEVGTTIFLLSLPLFIAGIRIFGKRYGFTSLLGTILLSLFITLAGLSFGFGGFLDYTDSVDTLLSAIFGGFLGGFGMGLVLKGGANTGGTDIAAQFVSKHTPALGRHSLFLVDGLVITAGGFALVSKARCSPPSPSTSRASPSISSVAHGKNAMPNSAVRQRPHEVIANTSSRSWDTEVRCFPQGHLLQAAPARPTHGHPEQRFPASTDREGGRPMPSCHEKAYEVLGEVSVP